MKTLITALSLSLSVMPAVSGDAIAVLNELSGEYQECSVYFAIATEAISRFSDAEVTGASKLAADYKTAQGNAMQLAAELALKVGVTPQAFMQRTLNITKQQKDLMQNSFVNISVLNVRYGTFCQQLMQDPTTRIQEIDTGHLCNGQYQCWQ